VNHDVCLGAVSRLLPLRVRRPYLAMVRGVKCSYGEGAAETNRSRRSFNANACERP